MIRLLVFCLFSLCTVAVLAAAIVRSLVQRMLLAGLMLFSLATASHAATYSLPAAIGSVPFSTCSLQSGASYQCPGNVSVGDNETIEVTSNMTLNVGGNFTLGNNSNINCSPGKLSIVAGGNVTFGNTPVACVNITAGGNVDVGNKGSLTGDIVAGGGINLGNNTNVDGVCNPVHTGGGTCGTAPTLSIANASIAEGNSGTSTLNFTVTLSASSTSVITVNFATSDGTATVADSDYVATSGTLTFSAGQTSKMIPVTINGDTKAELDETFTVTLSTPTNATLATATATGTILDEDPVADWRMDETSWNGTANEVKDSSGNNNHGRARIAAGSTALPTTAGVTKAYTSGGQSTCNYGQFDSTTATVRTHTYVELSALPALPTSYTFTAWIRSSNASAQHQRILVRDDADNGWGLSLADGTGQAKLRFFNRNITNSGAVTGLGTNPGCGVFCLDTNPVVTSGNWHFIAATIDTTGKSITLYVFNAAGTLLAKTTSAFTGTWQDGTGTAAIGGETSASVEGRQSSWHFLGNIDEVQIYRSALSQAQITALLSRVRTCSGGLHHLEIEHPSGAGLTCAANTLTIKACADGASPCTAYAGGVSGALTATGVTANWDGTTGGATGAGFIIPSGSSSVTKSFQPAAVGTLLLGATSLSPAATNATSCNFGSPSCTFTGASAGFVFSATATGGSATIPAQTAGIASATHYLRAVQSSTINAAVCTPAIISQSNVPVTLAYSCNDPISCQSGNLLTVNSTAIPASGGSVNLNFDANGSAPITLNYDDAGQITVAATKIITPLTGGTAVTLNGSSNPFVVKPDHFDLTGIQCADGTANPAAADASGAKFCRAGDSFSATVTARSNSNNPTKNYGKEISAETVRLSTAWVTGLGLTGTPPAVSGVFGAFNDGVASGASFSFGDVGIITLTPGVGDSDYLGAGDVTGGVSSNVGRFYPHHFDTVLSSACNTFSYSGQLLPLSVTARNLSGGVTPNYQGLFVKAPTFSDANGAAGTFSPASLVSGDFASGLANLLAVPTVKFTFSSKTTAPATLKLRVVDSDLASSASGSPVVEGSGSIRSGRLWLGNAYGSDQLALTVPVEVQYWNGSAFVKNTLDSCTVLAAGNIALGNKLGGLSTYAGPVTVSAIVGGAGSIGLAKPTAATAGSVDVMATLGSVGVPSNCNGLTGATSAALSHLSGKWCGASYDRDPVARATFGIAGSGSKKGPIYIRESY